MLVRFLWLLSMLVTSRSLAEAQIFPQTFANAVHAEFPDFPQVAPVPETDSDRSTNWKKVIPDLGEDQKKIYWRFPHGLIHGQHWIPTAAFLAVTGTLIAVDQYESPYFRRTGTYHGFNNGLSGTNSTLIIAAIPAATYLAGLITKNGHAQSTAILTGEAIADSELAAELLKLVTRRARPEAIQANGNFADTWVDSHTITDGGFPSGHTIAAFSAATVMSERYGQDHRWVPYIAYGVASTIGFSRVSLSAHNVSDVFAGAALGYAISRFVVLGHHRH